MLISHPSHLIFISRLLKSVGRGGSGVEEAFDDDDDMGMNDEGVSGTEHGDDDEVRRIKDIHM